MRIERDLKLTFDDVLIRPKRSTLVSRSDVNLVREFTFCLLYTSAAADE